MKLRGMVMRPCSLSEDDNESIMRSSKFFTDSGFKDKYELNIAANQIIAESAKIFILKNYQLIKDWSDLAVDILDNTGKETEYYDYKERKGWNRDLEFVNKMLAEREKNKNPIITLTDIVLDPTDGDFSVTINGRHHLWIDDASIIVIADFIEKQLPNPSIQSSRQSGQRK